MEKGDITREQTTIEETLRDHLSRIVLSYGVHPGKTPEEAAYFYIGPPEEVAPGVHFFTSIGNSVTFVCGDRLMQVDCNTIFLSPEIIEAMRAITDKPIDTIVITHGHVDHLLGCRNYINDNGRRGHARPKVVAHRRMRERINRYKRFDAYRKKTDRTQFQVEFDQTDAFVYADIEVDERLEITVGGREFLVRYGSGHTDDSCWVYAFDGRIACAGDLFQWTAPNVGNPLKVQRFARENALALKEMAALGPEILLPGHGPWIVGKAAVHEALMTTARYLDFVEEHVVACMNEGMWEEEIVERLRLPQEFTASRYVPAVYGHPAFIARGIYKRYAGYYTGNPAELFAPSYVDKAREVVALAGGMDRVLDRARTLEAEGRLELACQLSEWVVRAEPDDRAGWELYGLLFKRRAEAETNMQARGIWNSAVRTALTRLEASGKV